MIHFTMYSRRDCRPSILIVLMLYVVFFITMFTWLNDDYADYPPYDYEDELQIPPTLSETLPIPDQQQEDVADTNSTNPAVEHVCTSRCRAHLTYEQPHNATTVSLQFRSAFAAWTQLVNNAVHTIDIIDTHPYTGDRCAGSALQRQQVLDALLEASDKRNVSVRVLVVASADDRTIKGRTNPATSGWNPIWTATVSGNSTLQILSIPSAQAAHTHLWIVDGEHAYLGAANFEQPDVGVWLTHCGCLVDDLRQVFAWHWHESLKESAEVDQDEPQTAVGSTISEPMRVRWYETKSGDLGYVSDSYIAACNRWLDNPPAGGPPNATPSLNAILHTILSAQRFVNVALAFDAGHQHNDAFWLSIVAALHRAAEVNVVAVKVLVSYWLHDPRAQRLALGPLMAMQHDNPRVSVQVKRFIVPAQGLVGPRLSGNTYVCTESAAYVGAGNGLGMVWEPADDGRAQTERTIATDLLMLFWQDWNGANTIAVQPLKRPRFGEKEAPPLLQVGQIIR